MTARNTETAADPDPIVDAACAAYLAEVERVSPEEAAGLWFRWRIQPAEQGDKVAIDTMAEDRAAMRAALSAAAAYRPSPAPPVIDIIDGILRPHLGSLTATSVAMDIWRALRRAGALHG